MPESVKFNMSDRAVLAEQLHLSLEFFTKGLSSVKTQDEAIDMYRRMGESLAVLYIEPFEFVQVDECDNVQAMGKRLHRMFIQTNRFTEDDIKDVQASDLIRLAANAFFVEFSNLLIDSQNRQDSVEVYQTRVNAFVTEWVDLFLNKDE
ncbi:MAG: hypothetical protein SOT13_04320 [Candidatus Aphodousia sp.]|nr:hypothetical protein [Candidatus Aphodousia sp.]